MVCEIETPSHTSKSSTNAGALLKMCVMERYFLKSRQTINGLLQAIGSPAEVLAECI